MFKSVYTCAYEIHINNNLRVNKLHRIALFYFSIYSFILNFIFLHH